MKKVFLILILFLSCYIIYNLTNNKKINYLVIGDSISEGLSLRSNNYIKDYLESNKILKEYNNTFTNSDYRVKDIKRIIEYNEIKNNYSLNRLIKKSNIIILSIGMNELSYKLEKSNENIYSYIDNMINDYNSILKFINKFHHKKVFILGYYNVLENNSDIINYANYKLKKICKDNNYTYINISKYLSNNPNYLNKEAKYLPNIKGYEKISQIIVEKLENN